MSPKYRLRSAASTAPFPTNEYKEEKKRRTIFLPIMMIGVVLATGFMVRTTEPLALVVQIDEEKEGLWGTPQAETFEKVEIHEMSLDLSANRIPDSTETTPHAVPTSAPISDPEETDTFVAIRPLDLPRPIEEIAGPITTDPIEPKIEVVNSDYLLESITYSDPERDNTERPRVQLPRPKPSGLPRAKPAAPPRSTKFSKVPAKALYRARPVQAKPQPVLAPRPIPVTVPIPQQAPQETCAYPTDPSECFNITSLKNQEIQINLPGNTHRINIGECIENPSKLREVGGFLLEQLAKGGIINASVKATPDFNFDLSVDRSQVPQAKLIKGESDINCAVPIIHSVVKNECFTPWMPLSELDGYIKSKSKGRRSFWDQGHWVVAVEGRQSYGTHEYRIACEKTPRTKTFQWRYQISQSREDFNRKIEYQRRNGFRLIQSQMFLDHTDTPKFQAVWHRM